LAPQLDAAVAGASRAMGAAIRLGDIPSLLLGRDPRARAAAGAPLFWEEQGGEGGGGGVGGRVGARRAKQQRQANGGSCAAACAGADVALVPARAAGAALPPVTVELLLRPEGPGKAVAQAQ
jgi:hypothetical protein